MNTDFMQRAIEIAEKSGSDLPVGAVIVKNNLIISSFHNEKEVSKLSTAHAEILAINAACKNLNSWHLDDCSMYVTLEPCPMCAWAILESRISNLYFGSFDLIYGAFGSKINLSCFKNSKINIKGGILQSACDNLIKTYFKNIRTNDGVGEK